MSGLSGFTFVQSSAPGEAPAAVRAALEFLRGSPRLRLYGTEALASEIKRSVSLVRVFAKHPALSEYRYMTAQRRVYWGGKATIRELRKRLNANR